MNLRPSFLLIACLSCAVVATGEEPTAHPKTESTVQFEPGVRLRVHRVASPLYRLAPLSPDQSPNIDRTISRFEWTGDERSLPDCPPPYIAKLNARLRVASSGEYRFLLASDALSTLKVDQREIIRSVRSPHGTVGSLKLAEGEHDVEVTLAVNDVPPNLSLKWAGAGDDSFEPIATELLSTESFFFRPTNAGVKRLATEDDRPGRHQKVEGVYPGLDLATIRPDRVEVPVGGLATLADGTLVVATFDARRLKAPRPQPEPDGELWLYYQPHGDPASIRRERIATGLFEPAGVCVVGESIYVSQRLAITRFDKDVVSGEWRPTTVASGWESNDFHALSFGLLHEKGPGDHPGYLYMAKGSGLGLFQNPPHHGSVWRVDLARPAGENIEAITGGHRTPNGLGWGPEGTMFVTDNQGEFTPANELNLVREGAFYGFFHNLAEGGAATPFQPAPTWNDDPAGVTEATVWLPQDEIANSPTQPLLIPNGWPFAGQMLVGDMKYGGANRVFLEKVDGVWQGAAFRFTQGCEGGVNRMAFGPDGSLYVGGIGGDHASTWNWVDPQGRKTYQGLQRLRPNGRAAFDLERVSATSNGFEVHFTKPAARQWLSDPHNYLVEQWTYRATPDYGGPKHGLEQLDVTDAVPSSDGMSVALTIAGLKLDRVVHFLIDPVSRDGEEIWSAEAWYTLRTRPD